MIDLRGARMRRPLTVVAALAALAAPMSIAVAQAAAGGGGATVRVRTANADSARAHRERLLSKFDSLRNEYEHKRLTEAERDRLAEEMRLTVVALQLLLHEPHRTTVTTKALTRGAPLDRSGSAVAVTVRHGYVAGYLGASFDGPSAEFTRNNERIIRFLDYPRIALVDPTSPAERAGIQQGDTLLALDGTDVKERDISLTKLLIVDRRIAVRVRRDGTPMDFRVTVDEAPSFVALRAVPVPMPSRAPLAAGAGPGRVEISRRAPTPSAAPSGSVRSVWIMNDGIAGAKVETINEGLGRALGTKSGVLVLQASPGTPAHESGLREGDIILRAAGRTVLTVRELRSTLQNSPTGDGVKLRILRDRKQRDVTLRLPTSD